MKYAVVVGSYGMPEAVELNVKVLRHHLGAVPILIADDATPSQPGLDLQRIAAEHGCIFWPNSQRIGHKGGSLSVIWKGLQWANAIGADVLFRLGQRAIVDFSGWPETAWERMERDELHFLCNLEPSGPWEGLPIRYDAAALRVARWYQPALLAHLTPRALGPGLTDELILSAEVTPRWLGGRIGHWWELYDDPRYLFFMDDDPGVYRTVAERFGVTLPQSTFEYARDLPNYDEG